MDEIKQTIKPAALVIFGITGDLSHRKLMPAIYALARDQLLPDQFRIVGITRRGIILNELMDSVRQSLEKNGQEVDQKALDYLAGVITIKTMDLTKAEDFISLKADLDHMEDELGVCLNRLFYLSIPSTAFADVVSLLADAGLNGSCQHNTADSRLLVEKPFGYTYSSAQDLIKAADQAYSENQIYRIDHYLAKETVQNLLVFRSQNPMFRQIWNNRHITAIEIKAFEEIGIEGRATFYERMGALIDIIQSHLLQLMALVTMELPAEYGADSIHQSKEILLTQTNPPTPENMAHETIRAQYETYRQEVNNVESQIETFSQIQLTINNERWQGVPITLATGKGLDRKCTEVKVTFNNPASKNKQSNYFIMRIQPDEGISLVMQIKKSGYDKEVQTIQLDFNYAEIGEMHPDAYERVLVDALRGDKTLFATAYEVLESWRIIQPILESWQNNQVPLLEYPLGSNESSFVKQ